jgi:predicted pyridoxine 5'-phosphate oxidase superfamily flavin-nucleotide-binding protein
MEEQVEPNVGMTAIRTAEELEAYGIPVPMVRDKVLSELQDVHREWLAATPLAFVATSSADGRCDVSPKGDPRLHQGDRPDQRDDSRASG